MTTTRERCAYGRLPWTGSKLLFAAGRSAQMQMRKYNVPIPRACRQAARKYGLSGIDVELYVRDAREWGK